MHGGGEVLRGELTSGANLVTGNSPEAKNSDGQSIAGEGLNEFKRGLNEAISYPLGVCPIF